MRDPERVRRLLRIRTRICDLRRAELSIAQERERRARARLERDRADARARAENLCQPGQRTAADLLTDLDLLQRAQQSTDLSERALDDERQAVHQRSRAVHLARRDVKALQRVNDHLLDLRRKRIARAEQTQSDEAGTRKNLGKKYE